MAWPPTTHQDVQDDLTNGHGWASSLIERFGLGDQLLPSAFLWTSGRYYSGAMNASATTTNAITAGVLYLTPIYLPIARAVDQLACNVSTAGTAGHVARMGIYNSSASTGMPSTVKVDAGTVAVDSTGVKTLTIATTLTGLYWLALTTQSGTFTIHNAVAAVPVGGAASATAQTSSSLARSSTLATSALPDLTGDATVGAGVAGSVAPRILVRAA